MQYDVVVLGSGTAGRNAAAPSLAGVVIEAAIDRP
jgi:pyruvate/2-oxoglutarate dehydrogenase complex dihydrolipoamide dehydrogenase (E3) component